MIPKENPQERRGAIQKRCTSSNNIVDQRAPRQIGTSRNSVVESNQTEYRWIQASLPSARVAFGSTYRPASRSQSSFEDPTQNKQRLFRRPVQARGLFREGGFYGKHRKRAPTSENGNNSFRAPLTDHSEYYLAAGAREQPFHNEATENSLQ